MMMTNVISSTRIEMLTRDNYDSWCVQAVALLIKNDNWGYVNGDIVKTPAPEDTNAAAMREAQTAWINGDRKAKADLILSITPSIAKSVGKLEASKGVWMKLKETFASTGPIKKDALLHNLTLARMSEGDDPHEQSNIYNY